MPFTSQEGIRIGPQKYAIVSEDWRIEGARGCRMRPGTSDLADVVP